MAREGAPVDGPLCAFGNCRDNFILLPYREAQLGPKISATQPTYPPISPCFIESSFNSPYQNNMTQRWESDFEEDLQDVDLNLAIGTYGQNGIYEDGESYPLPVPDKSLKAVLVML